MSVEFLNPKKIKPTPGPGTYKPKVVKIKGGKLTTQSKRFNDDNKENRIGPGSYESADLDAISRVSSMTVSVVKWSNKCHLALHLQAQRPPSTCRWNSIKREFHDDKKWLSGEFIICHNTFSALASDGSQKVPVARWPERSSAWAHASWSLWPPQWLPHSHYRVFWHWL